MDREPLRNAVLALFGILAVALTAATLPTAVQREPRGDGGSGPPGAGDGDSGPLRPPAEGSPAEAIEIPFLTELASVLVVLMIIVVFAYLFVHWRDVFRAVVIVVAGFVVAWLLFQLFSPELSSVPPPSFEPWFGDGAAGGGGDPEATDPPFASVLVFLVLALALLGVAVAVWRRSDGGDSPPAGVDDANGVTRAMGRAAGRAADRIDGTDDVDNEVYRAWREMTSLLDVPRPETNTPGEFETAAVDAGMDRSDVHELTELFELVRYGEYDLGSDDERRAVELLERIERRYSEDGP